MILKKLEDVLKFLNNHFNDDLRFHEVVNREIFIYQSNRTGIYSNQKIDRGYVMYGLIGENATVVSTTPTQVVLRTTSRLNRRNFNQFNTITQFIDSSGNIQYDYVKFDEFLYENYLANIVNIRRTPALRKALEILGFDFATNEEIARVMATQRHTIVEDIPSILPEDVRIDIIKLDEIGIEVKMFIKNVETEPMRTRIWINPSESVTGINFDPNAAGDFFPFSKLLFTNNLSEREKACLMSPKNVEFAVQCQYKLESGEIGSCFIRKTIDFSDVLQKINYFSL